MSVKTPQRRSKTPEELRVQRRERRLVELRAQHRRNGRYFWIAVFGFVVFGFYLGLETTRREWGWVILFAFLTVAAFVGAILAHETRKDAERRLGNLGEKP